MKLLHEEYVSGDQLLNELPLGKALDAAANYFDARAEDEFGEPVDTTETNHDIMTRFTARKGA